MATVVPCASCYASSSVQPWGFFGRGPGGGYMSLLSYPGQRGTPKPRLAGHDPNLTLRQICHMLRVMRQVRRREAAAAAAAARKQASALGVPNSPTEKRCLPACFRRRRSNNLKRVS
ncbi:hypothetical protein AMEX_G12959 [Astyanax mexicanus]|uniref:Uncharacterized protein n=1 Tax=Astyanax mexicanus TaxID=7994 RepID=A0A8T2LQU4_ASTMX|nr:hypothetical protein AMEX_G12959 [Astyanax mexicanus]